MTHSWRLRSSNLQDDPYKPGLTRQGPSPKRNRHLSQHKASTKTYCISKRPRGDVPREHACAISSCRSSADVAPSKSFKGTHKVAQGNPYKEAPTTIGYSDNALSYWSTTIDAISYCRGRKRERFWSQSSRFFSYTSVSNAMLLNCFKVTCWGIFLVVYSYHILYISKCTLVRHLLLWRLKQLLLFIIIQAEC